MISKAFFRRLEALTNPDFLPIQTKASRRFGEGILNTEAQRAQRGFASLSRNQRGGAVSREKKDVSRDSSLSVFSKPLERLFRTYARKQFVQRWASEIKGTLSGLDRVRFRGTLRGLASLSGVGSYLGTRRCF